MTMYAVADCITCTAAQVTPRLVSQNEGNDVSTISFNVSLELLELRMINHNKYKPETWHIQSDQK
jgi:hypothetical protein